VQVAGNGAIYRQTLYPLMDGTYPGESDYKVILRTLSKTYVLETGTARASHRTGGNRSYNATAVDRVVAILDKRIGVLSPRYRGDLDFGTRTMYGKPQYAPDRAIGYDAVDTLVLGYGCETLSPAQWSAIREWVKDGGSLVMLGGSPEMRRVLSTPAALELSPVQAFATETRTATPRLRVSNFDISPLKNGYFAYDHDITERFPTTMTTAPRLKTDAKVIFQSPMQGRNAWATVAARRTFGAGSVAFYGFDPTVEAYRGGDSASLNKWWYDVSTYDKGALPSARMRNASQGEYINYDERGRDLRFDTPEALAHNPFYVQFPALPTVMYVFLGYFVLVVPVSFVVLKQTRRLNYAWFTAPAFAAVCAGSLALSTRSLYNAPQAVRTSGILALEAGDGTARFHGQSELYSRKAGRYTLTVPGTGQTFRNGTDYNGNLSDYAPIRDSVDAGAGEKPPTIEMGNLSFKRVYHDQTVTLGTGITLSLRATPDGGMKGVLNNGTGRTLRNVRVQMRGENTVFRFGATYVPVWKCMVKEVAPGSRTIVLSPYLHSKNDEQETGTTVLFAHMYKAMMPRTPFLTADIGGEPFAPQGFGKWAGGDHSVILVAKLPAVPESAMPEQETDPNRIAVMKQFPPINNGYGEAPPGFYRAPVAAPANAQGDNR